MSAIRLNLALCLFVASTSTLAATMPVLQPVTAPDETRLFASIEKSQDGWKLLLEAILANDRARIQQCGLGLLAADDPRSSFILAHLGILFTDYAFKPADMLGALETLPPAQVPSCRADRDELMMRLALRSLQVDKCELLAQKLGYIRQWALLGDINSTGRSDLEELWGVEHKPDPRGLTVSGIERKWFYPSSPADGWMNLHNILIPNEGVVYALSYVRIPIQQDVLFTWELEGSGMLYVDGRLLLGVDPTEGSSDRICRAVANLKPGWHRLVVKSIPLPPWFARQGFDWGFRLQLTTPDFAAINGLESSTDLAREKSLTSPQTLKIQPNPSAAGEIADKSRFNALMQGLDLLAKGNLTAAVNTLQDLNLKLNHSALSSWLYAQALLSHAEQTMRMQAATELSFGRDEADGNEGLVLLKNQMALENQDYDKVLDELGTTEANSPDICMLLGIAENRRGLAVQAEKHLRTAIQGGNGTAALVLARLLVAEDRQTEAASIINQAITADLNLRTQITDLYDVWLNMMPAEANQILAKGCRLVPFDLAMQEALLESTLAASTLPYALAQAREMITNHPYAENGYRRLAELSIFTYEPDAGKNAALELSHLRPGNDWARQYLEGIGVVTRHHATDFSYEEAISASTPADPESKVLYLLDETDYYVRDDYSFDEEIKRALRLETDDARDQFGEIALPDGAELLSATVVSPDGERHYASIISDPSGSATISFRGLQTGCIIEYSWLTHYAKRRIHNLPCFYFFAHGFAGTSFRLLHARIVVDAPKQFPIHNMVARFPGTFSAKQNKGRRIYTWELKSYPRIVPEPDMPSAFYIGPVAQGSSLAGLSPINEWLWGDIAPTLLPDEQVTQKAQTVTTDARTLEEKARLLFRYVDRNVERINGVILGPVPARRTLINHWGRGIDRAMLMICMLRAVGVECYLALLNSSPDLPGEETHPTLAYYDYALVYVPNTPGREIWLDPNAQRIGFGLLFEGILNKEATIFTGDDFIRKRTPRDNPEPALTSIKCKLTLSPEGWAEGTGTIAWSGLEGLARSSFTDPHTREKDAQSIAQSYLEEATITDVRLDGLEEPDTPLLCSFNAIVPHIALTSINGLELMSSVIKQNLCSQFISLPKRKYPMIIDRSFYQENHYEISLPEGLTIVPDSCNHHISNTFGEYKLEWRYSGGKLTVQRMINIPPQTISPTAYPGFSEFCRSVDQMDALPIEVKPE